MLFDGKNPIKQVFWGSRPLSRIYKGTLLIWTNNRKYARILLSAITRVYGAAKKYTTSAKASLSSAFAIAATAKKTKLNGKSLLKIIASITAKGRSGGRQIEHRATILSAVSATAANLTGNGSLLLANTLSASAAATDATSSLGVTTNCAMALSITAKVSAWEYPVYNAESKDLSITQVYSAGQVGSILSIN